MKHRKDDMMKLCIKKKLEEKQITRYELAKRLGITYSTINNMYKGSSTSVKLDILEQLCKILDCLPDEILILDDNNLQERQISRLIAYQKAFNKEKK